MPSCHCMPSLSNHKFLGLGYFVYSSQMYIRHDNTYLASERSGAEICVIFIIPMDRYH